MIPRMTTVGTLKNYRYTLNRSNNTMAKAMNTVTTRRNFNSYAENPALATRCFQIRCSYQRTEAQLTVNDSLRHKYDIAWEALGTVSTDLYALADDTAFGSIIRSMSDPTGPGRVALGQSLEAKAKDIAQTMNGRYGENYVYAGADTLNAPFTWGPQVNSSYVYIEGDPDPDNPDHAAAFQFVDGNGKLTNIEADAAPAPQENPDYNEDYTKKADAGEAGYSKDDPKYGKYLAKDATNGKVYGTDDDTDPQLWTYPKKNEAYDASYSYKYLKPDGTGTNTESEAATGLYYRGVPVDSMQKADLEKMKYFEGDESKYIDVGLGHKEDENGEAVGSTVFDCALQGTYYLGGYGTHSVEVELEDGSKVTVDNIPKNVISVVNELGQILQRCSADDGRWASDEDQLRFKALVQEFEDGTDLVRQRWTGLDTQTGFLRDNSELLEDTAYSLKQQYLELEEADPAAAISEYMFARYCYDAALKVGNSVLSQSLMDYMSF